MAKTQIGTLSISKKQFGTLPIQKEVLNGVVVYQSGPSVDPVLANNTWAVIKQVCESGQASNYWSVGDTKTDTGTDNIVRTFRIADMQGLYNKHVVFEQVNLYDTRYKWNLATNKDDANMSNNYSISTMVSTTLPAYVLLLSNDLQAILTNTTVKVGKNGYGYTILDVSGKLFLPAEKEITGTRVNSRADEFNALITWQYYTTHTTASDRIKYTSQWAGAYWLRSPKDASDDTTVRVNSTGAIDNDLVATNNSIAPCFAL